MHILYIYDEININGDDIDNNILESIKEWFSKIKVPYIVQQR